MTNGGPTTSGIPAAFGKKELDALMDGEITQEEYDLQSEETIEKCRRDGYAEMGYEIPEESAP
jgi:hypothetical protein